MIAWFLSLHQKFFAPFFAKFWAWISVGKNTTLQPFHPLVFKTASLLPVVSVGTRQYQYWTMFHASSAFVARFRPANVMKPNHWGVSCPRLLYPVSFYEIAGTMQSPVTNNSADGKWELVQPTPTQTQWHSNMSGDWLLITNTWIFRFRTMGARILEPRTRAIGQIPMQIGPSSGSLLSSVSRHGTMSKVGPGLGHSTIHWLDMPIFLQYAKKLAEHGN